MLQDNSAEQKHRELNLWIETGLVLLVGIVPSLFNSMAALYLLEFSSYHTFLYDALAHIVHSAVLIGFMFFIISKSGEPPSRFGLRPFSVFPDIFGGASVLAVGWIAVRLVWLCLPIVVGHDNYLAILHHRYSHNYPDPAGVQEFILLGISSLAVGLSEELVIRSYLITRFERLLESTPLALLLTTVIFASFHGYQGTPGVIGTAVDGVVLGLVFCVFRRLWPLVLAHALHDFLAGGHFLRL